MAKGQSQITTGEINPDGTIEMSKGASDTDGGIVDGGGEIIIDPGFAIVVEASRISGVSPCPVVLSFKDSIHPTYNIHEVFGTGGANNIGFKIDWGDPGSGNYNTAYGSSKEITRGGAMGAHTYELADGQLSKEYTVTIDALDAQGLTARTTITITVQAQDAAYTNVVAISNTLPIGNDWSLLSGDRVVPSGATQYATMAEAGNGGNSMFWDEVANTVDTRFLLHRGDDFSAEGNLYFQNGVNNFAVSWFGDELSGTVITGSGISFAVASEADKTNGIGGTILDSDNQLAGLTVGAEIDITGSTSNDSRRVIRSVAAGVVTIRYNNGDLMLTESAGASITLTEHTKLPEIGGVYLGTRTKNDTNVKQLNDSQLAGNVTKYGNDGWCENVVFDGLRVLQFDWGLCSRHVTLHRIDCDHEDTGVMANQDPGGTTLANGNYAWDNPTTLNPDSLPYPYGLYFSDCVFIGSTANIAANGRPNINFNGVSGGMPIFSCMIGVTLRKAQEHNYRMQGYQNWYLDNVDFLGQHIGGQGPKLRLAHRGRGINRTAMLTIDSVKGDHAQNADNRSLYPHSRFSLIQYYFDSASSTGESTASGFGSADETRQMSLHEDGLVNDVTFDPTSDNVMSKNFIIVGGKNCAVTKVTGLYGGGIQDLSEQSALNNGPDNEIINSVINTVAGYLGPMYLSGSVTTPDPDEFNLPVVP